MGSLKEKLEYLRETKELLFPDFMEKQSQALTFRERIKWALDFVELFSALVRYSYAESEPGVYTDRCFPLRDITLADGSVVQAHNGRDTYFVIPHIVVGNYVHGDGYTYVFPFMFGGSGVPNYDNGMQHIDLSRIELGHPNASFAFYGFAIPRSLILPDRVTLRDKTFYAGKKDTAFVNGLRFGKSVVSAHANWIGNSLFGTLPTDGVPVYVGEGFTGTLYLSALSITYESLIGIIDNLADLSDSDTTYTLNIGDMNLAKLSDEEIAIAEEKGWIVT